MDIPTMHVAFKPKSRLLFNVPLLATNSETNIFPVEGNDLYTVAGAKSNKIIK
jgi:hypothetical protein